MRQVPAFSSYLVVGRGRVARHFSRYFELLSIPFLTWDRSQPTSEFRAHLRQASHVLLLISDPAIPAFAQEHSADLSSHVVVHCSASVTVPGIYGAHPLMTFADELYDLATYREIPFILEAEQNADFQEILPRLNNPHFHLPRAEKDRYHALCVLSGNFTTLLWEHAFKEFAEKLNIPKEVLLPFLNQTALNLERSQPGQSVLTGPLARNDTATIDRHLAALEDDPFREVYESFVRVHRS